MNSNMYTRPDLLKFKFSLLIFVIIIYLFFASGLPWVESDFHLQRARNFMTHHTLSTDKPFAEYDARGVNGRFYDPDGLTNILLMIPIASLENILNEDSGKLLSFLGALTGTVINAVTCLIFFLILLLFRRPIKTSFYATLCLAFLTIVFPYSSTNYEGNLNMLFTLCALYFIFAFRRSDRWHHLVFAGAFSGLAVNTRDSSLVVLFCLGIYVSFIAIRKKRPGIAALFASTVLPFLIIWGCYNWMRTGQFFISPIIAGILNGRDYGGTSLKNIVPGLYRVLFSPGKSLFIYSPILLPALLGWPKFFKDRKGECLLTVSIIILLLFVSAKAPTGETGLIFCWGSRYTMEIVPLMMLPLGYLLTAGKPKNSIKTILFILICGFSLLIQLSALLTHWHSRIGYLVSKGIEPYFFSVWHSQWWDSLKTLFINIINLMCGPYLHIENPGYDPTTSAASMYAANTVFTWWNRLFFMGVNPIWISIYVILSFVSLFYLWRYMKRGV